TAETYQLPLSSSESPSFCVAGVLGLEPRLTEPESVGLPITLYPTGVAAASYPPGHEDKPYCKPLVLPNDGWEGQFTSGRIRWRGLRAFAASSAAIARHASPR